MTKEEMNYKQADLFIESVRTGMHRTRWAYSVVVIISITIFICSWNVYFSWVKTVFIPNKIETVSDTSKYNFIKDQEIVKLAQQYLLKNWTESNYIEIPLLGSKFNVTDSAILLSCMVLLILIWLFFATRRENHIIGRTLQLYQNAALELQVYIYYGISFSNLFSTFSKNDEPIYTLAIKDISRQIPGIRFILLLIFYLPGLLLLGLLILDLSSFSINSMYRESFNPPNHTQHTLQIMIMEIFCLICSLICLFLGYRSHCYEKANAKILNEYAENIDWKSYSLQSK